MRKMVNGQNNKSNLTIVLITLMVFVSCNFSENTENLFWDGKRYVVQYDLDTIKLLVNISRDGIVRSVTPHNQEGQKDGTSYEYYDSGILKIKSNWKNDKQNGGEWTYDEKGNLIWYYNYLNGLKDGLMYEFDKSGGLKQNTIFKEGQKIYTGVYINEEKQLDILYHVYLSESIKDSVYKAKAKFLFDFKGSIDVLMRDTLDFDKEFIDKNTFEITIRNAHDLKKYDMLFIYHPSEEDTLLYSEYTYDHDINLK